jgi:hypothetical protein
LLRERYAGDDDVNTNTIIVSGDDALATTIVEELKNAGWSSAGIASGTC